MPVGFVDDCHPGIPLKTDDEERIRRALDIWETTPAHPAKVADYLKQRGIAVAEVPTVLKPSRVISGFDGPRYGWNGILAAVQQLDGRITAVHNKGRGEKGVCFGVLAAGAVQLGASANGELGLAEGIETALSATILTGVPCWATLSAKRLDAVDLPDSIRRVHLFGDNDDAGRQGVDRATARFSHLGLPVSRWWPPNQYNDWNDLLRGGQ